jgi:hypothetical protein
MKMPRGNKDNIHPFRGLNLEGIESDKKAAANNIPILSSTMVSGCSIFTGVDETII